MIELRYKCHCMPAEVSLKVRFRRADEDIIEWMEGVVRHAIGADHRRRSPIYRATAMEYAKIPAPENAPFIGGKPELNG
jgi:hypothetical protein